MSKSIRISLFFIAVFTVLFIVSRYNYVLFHTLAELFGIIIACCLFVIVYNSRHYSSNNYLLFIGISYLFVAFIDMLHTIAYKGINVFKGHDDNNLAPQLWLVARYMEALALLLAPVFLKIKKFSLKPVVIIFKIITALSLLSIFYWHNFPTAFETGKGLTDFKIYSEYAIITILVAAAFALYGHRSYFSERVVKLLLLSIASTIATELCFTQYVNLYGTSNFVGHLFKILAFYFMYAAIVETNLKNPIEMLFRDIQASKEAAERANRAKSDFLATMSHEIRTPLNAIIGMTNLTLQMPLEREIRDNLEITDRASRSLLELINDILDLSRIERGQMVISPVTFDMRMLLKDIEILYRNLAAQKGLSFEIEIEDTLENYFVGDSLRLKQVLINLLGNAIKFTDKGFVRLIVNNYKDGNTTDSNRLTLLFTVEDSGIGIAPEKQLDIFDPFVQADNSTARQYGGTGLGLSISKRLLELMGGSIWLKSDLSKGSIFSFTLPLQRSDGVHSAEETIETKEIDFDKGMQLNILVVEDNELNQVLAKKTLERMGFHVVITPNGRAAIEALKNNTFDIVLMDVMMPGMDGYETTRLIRDPSTGIANSSIPIIAMTANAMSGDRERCLEAGMNDYISKPFSRDDLFKTIYRVLDYKNN